MFNQYGRVTRQSKLHSLFRIGPNEFKNKILDFLSVFRIGQSIGPKSRTFENHWNMVFVDIGRINGTATKFISLFIRLTRP